MPALPNTWRVVQCARRIGLGQGVAGPALQLERAFQTAGLRCSRFTLDDLGIAEDGPAPAAEFARTWRLWRDILLFSSVGSIVLWWRYRRPGLRERPIVVTHVDAMVGDVFVVRAIHPSFLRRRGYWKSVLSNPLHLLILTRDRIRYGLGLHRRVVALSERNAADLENDYGIPRGRLDVIPNGVDCSRFRPDPLARSRVREELSLADETPVACFVGNEFERKGLDLALEGLEATADWHLLVVGDDATRPYRERLTRLGPRVQFLGHREDVEALLAASDAFLLPTRHDVTALVGLEAMACGLPILMTAVGGTADYLEDGTNGFVITDPCSIAEALARLGVDSELRHRMGANSRQRALAHDWSRIAQRFLELFEELGQTP